MNDDLNIDALKEEATDLGIKFNPNIGAEKLQSKIEEFYASQETSGKELIEAVVANEKAEEKSAETNNNLQKVMNAVDAIKAAANKTVVVTIIDNDPRVNSQTTSCTVNCSNEYFDLGTRILPLNIPVEVRVGHLNVLKEIKIPMHIKDPKTGLSTARMVNRYTISYEAPQV